MKYAVMGYDITFRLGDDVDIICNEKFKKIFVHLGYSICSDVSERDDYRCDCVLWTENQESAIYVSLKEKRVSIITIYGDAEEEGNLIKTYYSMDDFSTKVADAMRDFFGMSFSFEHSTSLRTLRFFLFDSREQAKSFLKNNYRQKLSFATELLQSLRASSLEDENKYLKSKISEIENLIQSQRVSSLEAENKDLKSKISDVASILWKLKTKS